MRAHFGEQPRRMASVPPRGPPRAGRTGCSASSGCSIARRPRGAGRRRRRRRRRALGARRAAPRAGVDWSAWFAAPTGAEHNVNLAQGLKSGAAWHRVNASDDARAGAAESRARVAHLDAAFGPDRHVQRRRAHAERRRARARARRSAAAELCGVAEAMFSYATMLAAFGDASHADRLERIAFNAPPATWASPTGGDMWAHQYLQAVNEMSATRRGDDYVWTHDNGDSET